MTLFGFPRPPAASRRLAHGRPHHSVDVAGDLDTGPGAWSDRPVCDAAGPSSRDLHGGGSPLGIMARRAPPAGAEVLLRQWPGCTRPMFTERLLPLVALGLGGRSDLRTGWCTLPWSWRGRQGHERAVARLGRQSPPSRACCIVCPFRTVRYLRSSASTAGPCGQGRPMEPS